MGGAGSVPSRALVRSVVQRLVAGGEHAGDGSSAVCLDLPVGRVVATFRPDMAEHERRVSLGVAGVLSLGALHDLWDLPSGLAVARAALDAGLVDRLVSMEGFVAAGPLCVRRDFQPAGVVSAAAMVGRDAHELLRRVSMLSPVVQRSAVLAGRHEREVVDELSVAARGLGLGLTVARSDGGFERIVVPAPAVLGVPHVYRWWLGELGYQSWLECEGRAGE